MHTGRHVWIKSSYSAEASLCVEVAQLSGRIGVRDSKDPHTTHLEFGRDSWAAFLYQAKHELLGQPIDG